MRTYGVSFMLAASWFAASVLAQSSLPARPWPPVPYDDAGACPFEGCVYGVWTANENVVVRRDPQAGTPVVYNVKKGERVTALTGIVRTLKAGRVEFRQPVDISVLKADKPSKLRIEPGQSLYLLTYHGEGEFKAWFRGTLYDSLDGTTFFNAVCESDPSRCLGKIVEPTQWVWWVQIRNARGQVGWTNQPDRFDGKDMLGAKDENGPEPSSTPRGRPIER